jgi:UDP-N-acetylmuramoyl-L-alanyl-D-glutamate--2,6-diaminopimelate ligase
MSPDLEKKLKRIYWKSSAKQAARKFPLNPNLIYVGITGTDGKTTTSSFLYEIAKAYGYKPLLLSTVSAKFDDKKIDANLKSTSFFAYSAKNFLSASSKLKFGKALKNLFFLDKKGFEEQGESHRTTPLAGEIRRLIKEYEEKGANFIILETTSHAIHQYRTYGITFDSIAYTNITNEHLDYHGSWEEYAKTKAQLILQVKENGGVGLNRDDEKSFKFLSDFVKDNGKSKVLNGLSYGLKDSADPKNFWISIDHKHEKNTVITASPEKTHDLDIQSHINIFGDYNIYNAMAALSCFMGLFGNHPELKDQGYAKAIKALSDLKDVEGRMNFLLEKPRVIVDFAHTPNAFDKSLSSVRRLITQRYDEDSTEVIKPSKLWVVFGTAGLRDKYKRPEMGRIAFEYADNILITSEDPRTESLHEINNEIIQGFKHSDDEFTIETYYEGLKYEPSDEKFIVRFDEPSVNSRRNAIQFALKNAAQEDIILILGKGHETTMCFGTKEYEWNDIEEVKRLTIND